jgi:pyruvate/2-oxoglutarate dehydrogenase complex dihydrolipoamide acyltransferase (E2) component
MLGDHTCANASQGGVFGSLMGTPIINLPQTGMFILLTR